MIEDDDDTILIWLTEAAAMARHIALPVLHQLVRRAIAENELDWDGPPSEWAITSEDGSGWKGPGWTWPSYIDRKDLKWLTATLDFSDNWATVPWRKPDSDGYMSISGWRQPSGRYTFPLRIKRSQFLRVVGLAAPPSRPKLTNQQWFDLKIAQMRRDGFLVRNQQLPLTKKKLRVELAKLHMKERPATGLPELQAGSIGNMLTDVPYDPVQIAARVRPAE